MKHLIPLFTIYLLSKFLRHVTKLFIANKPYFFSKKQSIDYRQLCERLFFIFTRKFDNTGILIFLSAISTYAISISIGKSIAFSLLESALLSSILSACIMDYKTMTIDYFLSYAVLILGVLASGIIFKFNSNSVNIESTIAYISIILIWIGIYIASKIIKKDILGGADVDFFIGMIVFFEGYYIYSFIIISCLLGVAFKLAINKIQDKNKKTSEFPFLPAISLAFYFLRLFIFLNSYFTGQ